VTTKVAAAKDAKEAADEEVDEEADEAAKARLDKVIVEKGTRDQTAAADPGRIVEKCGVADFREKCGATDFSEKYGAACGNEGANKSTSSSTMRKVELKSD
jgi:hypothetical protein